MHYEKVMVPSSDGYSVAVDQILPEVMESLTPDLHRPALVICPGGGYEHLSHREAEPIALTFAAMGYNTFIVWYRLAPNTFPRPVQDVAAAVAWVRAHAKETKTDPDKISVLGFSAGGHCAGSLGVWWPKEELWQEMGLKSEQVKPNAMVLCYPVITGGEKAHRGSFVKLTGSQDLQIHKQFSLEDQVSALTPPAFLWHTWDDGSVPVENTLYMAQALKKFDIQSEVHIFKHGPHGVALGTFVTSGSCEPEKNFPDCAKWPVMADEFLRYLYARKS